MASQPAVRSPHIADLGTPTQPYPERRPSPERLAKLGDGTIAIFIAFVAQLLIAGFQCGLGGGRVDFPASILAMAAVFVIFSVSGCVLPGVEDFYCKRLKGAVSTSPYNCAKMGWVGADQPADGPPEPPHVHRVHHTGHHDMSGPHIRCPHHCNDHRLLR